MDFSAEQVRQFAADCQPQAGPGVRLLERFKDQLLLIQRDTDARVRNLESDNGRRRVEDRVLGAPSTQGGCNAKPYATFSGELECIRQQVFQDLLQTFGVRDDAATQVLIEVDIER